MHNRIAHMSGTNRSECRACQVSTVVAATALAAAALLPSGHVPSLMDAGGFKGMGVVEPDGGFKGMG